MVSTAPSVSDRLGSGPTHETLGWNVGHVVASMVAGLVGSVLMVLIAVGLGGHATATTTDTADLWVLALSQVGLWGGLAGGPWLVSRRLGSASLARDFGLVFRRQDVLWALLGPVLQVAISLAYSPFVSNEEVSKVATDLAARAHGSPWQFALLAVATAVGAPIVEETFFRGMFLRVLRRRLGAVLSMVICGVVFGLFHFEPLQFPALAVFGMIASALAVVTGRLGASIWLHIGFNASTMVALALQTF